MAEIRLWNTKTKRKDPLEPTVTPGKVSMYVCGPTVYDRAHMGNARPAIVFDVLARLLRHVYGPDNVRYVRNLTDVDDKIIRRAEESGRAIDEITEETIRWYHEDMAALGVLPPDEEPRATQYIAQMIAMIERLIASGHAYAAEGHVLFSVESYAEYGALSGRSVDDMIAGARVEVAPYKKNPMDFVLWKPSEPDLPGWDSPWGRGRPGWHIECSAMSEALLGESFDIHGGGNDLMFPHHENEIAQSRCAHPGSDFARIWMHNEMLQVEGKKMSKSLGNFFTVRDLLNRYSAHPYHIPNMGPAIRLRFLQTSYRDTIDITDYSIEQAAVWLGRAYAALDDEKELWDEQVNDILRGSDFIAALADDLNTHLAVTKLQDQIKRTFQRTQAVPIGSGENIYKTAELDEDERNQQRLKAMLQFLGFNLSGLRQFHHQSRQDDLKRAVSTRVEALIQALLQERQKARQNKDFARADQLRDGFKEAGLVVTDTPTGPEWAMGADFDPEKLEALK
ncbi:cysteine--tRNA ligase [Tropicimonas isoalkanivorans]|uniref:Cysteine--tRNA ligase n=1 Tax=Tropicimonas isoalkanivorans TaxID=441112 RepID=A0A1I1IL56_9RHOB|nr:cysteine--tRNA ligase [Tropicimonas isoalkanivorans]SFC37014.1 cysteinyl-tRNA synthetase [Tropicimonas isoalkanivorans]